MKEGAVPKSSGLARVVRGLGWVVGGLALTLLTAWVGAYFWLGSGPGRAFLGELASGSLPDAVSLGLVKWGPWPGELAAGELVVRDAAGRALLTMGSASAEVGLGALVDGQVVIDRLEVDIARIEARRDAEGRVDLAAALAPPKVATAAAGAAPRARKPPVIEAMRVRVGELWIDLGTEQVHVRDLGIGGALHADGSLAVAVGSGSCHAAWNKLRRSVGFSECRLAADVVGRRAEVTALELTQGGDIVLALQGWMDVGATPRGRWTGHGALGADEAGALVPGMFPLGVGFDGLALELAGSELTGSIGQLFADRWVSGPLWAEHVSLAVPALSAEPGLLVPEMTLAVEHLAMARLEGLDWRLEGVWIPRATGALDRKLLVDAAGWSSAWTMPSGEVGPVDLLISTEMKLTGGRLVAQVRSALGLVEAIGTLKTSPLTKKTDFVAQIAFAEARGPLAAAFMHELDDAQREALGEPIAGAVEIDVEVDRKERLGPWHTELEWALGRLEGKTTLEWDGYGWGAPAEAAPVEAPAPDEESP